MTFDNSDNLKLSKHDHISPWKVSSELQIKYCLIGKGALLLSKATFLAFDLHELG